MIEKFSIGKVMQTNCYVVFDEETKDTIIIDPGDEDKEIIEYIEKNELKVKYIYLTHCHFDHILGASWFRDKLNVPIACLDKEADNVKNEDITMGKALLLKEITVSPDKLFFENDEIELGNLILKVIHTPGHTSGSSCLYGNGILISGDTLFKGNYGRCDLPTGNLYEIIKSIKNKLFELPDDTIVYPGHGEATTIKSEKDNDDYL